MPLDNKPLPTTALNAFTQRDIAWMAGLLEGEAYFHCAHNRVTVRLSMTDEDVVARFAAFWHVKVRQLRKRVEHHKIPFLVSLPNQKAKQCMQLIRPFMGLRRMQAIDDCLQKYEQQQQHFRQGIRFRQEKFTDAEFIELWETRPAREAIRPFCERVGLGNRTVVKNRLQRLRLIPSAAPEGASHVGAAIDLLTATPELQSAWMAGLLDGEAYFHSKGAAVAVVLKMTDSDVVARFAALSGVRSSPCAPTPHLHFKPLFIARACGHRGAAVMERILPFVGDRRFARITECLQQRFFCLARLQARRQAFRSNYEAHLPAPELVARWSTRGAGETLRFIAREYGVHPQRMKDRLVQLGVYTSPVYKSRTSVTRCCEFCGVEFTRPATFTGRLCSMTCSGRAQAQRRATQRNAAIGAPL